MRRERDGYMLVVESGQRTRVTNFTENALQFRVLDDVKTELSLWLTSPNQFEGTISQPGRIAACQRGTVRGQKR